MTNKEKIEKLFDKLGDAVTGPPDLLGSAEPSILFRPMVSLMKNPMSCDVNRMVSKKSLTARRLIHPFLIRIAPLFLERKQVFENKNDLLGINAPDDMKELPKEPVIWCSNHGFKDDIAATVVAARHAYILFGSLPAFFNTFDGISAYLNGVVICNRKVQSSKKASIEGAVQVLNMGTDILMFPEGVWNKTPDRLMLDLWPGAYRIAKEKGCKIVPVIHYLADPHKKYKGNVIHTVVADPISMEGVSEKEGLELLRDTMATWYYLMMERYGHSTRKKLLEGFETSDDAWENYIAMHTGLIRYYDREIELKADYRPRNLTRPEDVWQSIAAIKNVRAENINHIRYAQQQMQQEQKRDFQHRY
ncbi:MAG: 1-acyl-sn-glycerol-3-phosphate acyltransferase [Lachnospiraceae bacterium]|nr:1-acyl-sn-glycerol-3-phosphate acyltransferase [Lachnospiraceae bacterium]